jgi:RNA polymerase sigma-70 factor (ECF subfamily)
MPRRPLGAFLHLQELVNGPGGGPLSDGQLLERFVTWRDESAFEALLRRHGPLVLRVCRRVLNDCDAAEDAFQATFLVLARKAGSIGKRESVGSWLYGTAFRVARKARTSAARRLAREARAAALIRDEGTPERADDLRPLLDEELQRLTDRDRAPLVLCYLEGKTYGQAARELGWSESSMSRRLAQARERLRQRLVRRGVLLSVAGLASVLTESASAAVPGPLMSATVRGASALAAGNAATVSPAVLALTRATLQELSTMHLKITAAVILALGGACASLGISAAKDGDCPAPPLVVRTNTPRLVPPAMPAPAEPMTENEEDAGAEEAMNVPDPPLPDRLAAVLADDSPPPPPPLIKRRNLLDEETLRRQLAQLPELSLDRDRERRTTRDLAARADTQARDQPEHLLPGVLATRPDLAGLTLTLGDDCKVENPQKVRADARLLREVLGALDDRRHVPETLRKNFRFSRAFKEQYTDRESVRVLVQMLTAQDAETRRVLVEQLARIDGPESSVGLARLALFDLSPVVRTEAVRALEKRLKAEYRTKLLEGLRHPWPVVADHAAEALAALGAHEAVPALRELANAPDPTAPFYDAQRKTHVQRELVRVNHLRNCMLCHAPMTEGGLPAPVPQPNKPLPPLTAYYLKDHDGILVRADIVYLRQDFSVEQPVANAEPWPSLQRYDYLVHNRALTPAEQRDLAARQTSSYPQRDAVLFALKELSGP